MLAIAYEAPFMVREIGSLKRRLAELVERRAEEDAMRTSWFPAVVTDAARPAAIEACAREGVALLDLRGTFILHGAGVYVHVVGDDDVERARQDRLFSGKSSLLVRHLLSTVAFARPAPTKTAQRYARELAMSYAHAHSVLTRLEREGFMHRTSARAGFTLVDAPGLLRAWRESGDRAARYVHGFASGSTERGALAAAARRLLQETGEQARFTLGSALEGSERSDMPLQHGVYCRADLARVVECFGLRREGPHDFFVLFPDDEQWTERGGLLELGREGASDVDGISCVALPQLVIDFATIGDEPDEERADALFETYVARWKKASSIARVPDARKPTPLD